MTRSLRVFAVMLAVLALLFVAARAPAQTVVYYAPSYYAPPVVSYYAPPAVSYYAAPTVSYYAAPAVSYYAAPAVSYYAPTVSYYAPSTVSYYAAPTMSYYAPAPAVTTYYRYGLFGRRVGAVTYYP